MIHPCTELRLVSKEVGYGVFATAFIPKGTIVYIKDALEVVVKPDDPLRNDPRYSEIIEKYSYMEPNGNMVLSWDIAKFVNHCCNCNIISTGYGFEIAIRDIQADEEITDEYGLFNSGWEMDLVCKQPGCRKKLTSADLEDNFPIWDEKIQSAFRKFNEVSQPLLKYIDQETYTQLKKYLEKGEDYRSVINLKVSRDVKI